MLLALIMITGLAAYIGFNVYAESSIGEIFDYSSSSAQLKYKASQSDSADPTKKGLLLYGYDAGASAEFKAGINGTFSADLKALKNGNAPDLSKYSLVFTDKSTGKSFSVVVESKGSYNNVYVSVDGNNAGIYYYTTQYDVNGTAYGYTARYNSAGTYTNVASDEIRIEFDPATMQVNVLGNGGAYHPVWNFSEEYNDGKQLKHDLPQFGEYTVSVVFDEVRANGRGELLVYSFGGQSFDGAYADSKISLYANVTANAIVGQEYRIPQAQATDLIAGGMSSDNVSVSVYDVNGNILNNGEYKFTPSKEGEYFIYYSYKTNKDEKPVAALFYRVVALDKASCTYNFTYDDDVIDTIGKIGAYKTVYIPKGSVNSDLFISGNATATVTIKKDGVPVDGYENVAGGFTYTFKEAGTYSLIWSADTNDTTLTDEKTVTVSADIPNYVIEEVSESMQFFSSIKLTAGKVYVNNTSYEMSVSMKYPSGKVVRNAGEYVLDELGTYVICNEYGGKVYEQRFTARQLYSDLFSGDFTSTEYGTLDGNNTINGQIVTLTNGNSVKFTKVIDLSDNVFNESLDDKSQNTPLLELYAQPHSLDISDIQTLYITLTDKYDSNNYIIIRVNLLSYLPNNMRIRTMASGQSWVGYDYEFYTGDISVDSAQGHDDGGTIVSFDCAQSANGRTFDEKKLRLYFDNTTGRLYTRTWQDKAGNSTADNYIPIPWLVRDYKTTDPKLSAGDTPWKGFTTGEVYLSVYATGISDTADFLITNIDGEDLTEKYYTDDVAPTINVDVNENDVPFAKVGKEFKVFDYVAEDAYSFVTESTVKVFHGGKEIALNEGVFVPQEVGVYTIVYTATDSYGNTTTKTINVEAKNTLPKLDINIDGTVNGDISFGELIQLPTATGVGGSGGITVTTKVTAVDADKNIEIKNGSFRCLYSGSYRIEYIIKDYVGNTVSKSLWIDVSFSTAPVFDEKSIVLPNAFISGDAFQFSEYFAIYYNGNGGNEKVKAVITVTDANGTRTLTDGKYIPAASETCDTAVITLSFTANGQTITVAREVPILTVNRGLGYLANYFVTNGTINPVNYALVFTPDSTGMMDIAFAKAISQKYLTIGMKRENVGSFTEMNIYLRDVSDPDATVKLTYRNRSGSLTLSINDGVEYKANFDTEGNFAIKYDNAAKRILDVLGMEIGTITEYQNGSKFNGFPSGMVYMEIETDGSMALTSIANQNFNNYVRDSIEPLLDMSGSFSGKYLPTQTVKLPSATAYDVLSTVGEVKVVVKSPSGEIVASGTADKEMSFVPQNYGTYTVIYSVSDSSGNEKTYSSSFMVLDDVDPTLSFDGSVPESAKVGTSITLPKYTISDNGDIGKIVVKNYVCGPDGIMLLVSEDGTVNLDKKGTYIIYYFVVDDNDNTTNYTFKISVS